MCPMPFNYYALCSLKLKPDIIFTHMVRFKHMTRHFNCFNLKICLITFSYRSDGQKHCWFKTLIQTSCALSVFRILICKNSSLCEGQNIGSKVGCQQEDKLFVPGDRVKEVQQSLNSQPVECWDQNRSIIILIALSNLILFHAKHTSNLVCSRFYGNAPKRNDTGAKSQH